MSNTNYKPGLKRDVDKKLVSELTDNEKIDFTIAGYNKIADEWDKTRQNLWPELEAQIIKYINPGTRILDLGCGNGRLIPLIDELNINGYELTYTGIDPSTQLINIAKDKYEAIIDNGEEVPSITLETFDGLTLNNSDNANNINLDNESFDQVISIAVLHHIPPSLLHSWLSESYRVSAPGATNIFTTWNLSESKYDLNDDNDAVIGFIHTPNTRYVHYYNYEEIREVFENVGYNILEIKDIKRESGMSNTVIVVQK